MVACDDVGCKVAVAKNDALGTSGSAGSINDGRYVVWGRNGCLAVACEVLVVGLKHFECVHLYDQSHLVPARLAEFAGKFLRYENDFAFRVFQYVGDFVFGTVGKNRDCYTSERHDGEECHRPVRHAL